MQESVRVLVPLLWYDLNFQVEVLCILAIYGEQISQ